MIIVMSSGLRVMVQPFALVLLITGMSVPRIVHLPSRSHLRLLLESSCSKTVIGLAKDLE